MSEYFMWVNPAKKEKLVCDAFGDFGFMLSCSMCTTTTTTRAVETLLTGPWKGELVVYLGDYFDYDESWKQNNPTLVPFFDPTHQDYDLDFIGNPYEIALNCYKDIGGRFKESRGREYTEYWDGEQWEDRVYDGPFDLMVKDFRYALNHDMKEYVSLDVSWDKCRTSSETVSKDALDDPLPKLLCARARPGLLMGRWAGNLISVSNDCPQEYKYLDWKKYNETALL